MFFGKIEDLDTGPLWTTAVKKGNKILKNTLLTPTYHKYLSTILRTFTLLTYYFDDEYLIHTVAFDLAFLLIRVLFVSY